MAVASVGTSPHLRLSYLGISTILRRGDLTPVAAPRATTAHARRLSNSRQHASNGTYQRSDFSNQGYTGFYEPRETTPGPLRDAHIPPRITPRILKEHLDAYVVGQDRAKRVLATAVYNHYQRIQELQRREEEEEDRRAQHERRRMSEVRRHPVEGREHELKSGIAVPSLTRDFARDEDEFPGQQPTTGFSLGAQPTVDDWRESGPGPPSPLLDDTPLTIEKSNILLLGPSGVGKTLMVKTLARVLEVPFSMSDCTPFTQAGYIGEDADVCVSRLLSAANFDVARAERGIVCLDEIDKIAAARVSHGGRDVSGEGVQQALLKIIEGTTLQIQAKQERSSAPSSSRSSQQQQQGYPTNSPLSGGNSSQQSSSTSTPGGKSEVYNVRTDNILFICAGAFNGLHKLILDRVSKGGLGFGATVRAARGSHSSTDTSLHDTILEGEDGLFEKHLPYYVPPLASTEPGAGRTTRKFNTLDLVQPQDLQQYGLIPELVGRVPISCALSALDTDALVQVLTEPRNSLLRQLTHQFALSAIELRITSPALRSVARAAAKTGTGARGLKTVLDRLLGDAMFDSPGSGVKYVLVTEDVAERRCAPLYFYKRDGERMRRMWREEEELWEERQRTDVEAKSDAAAGVTAPARTFEEYRGKVGAVGVA